MPIRVLKDESKRSFQIRIEGAFTLGLSRRFLRSAGTGLVVQAEMRHCPDRTVMDTCRGSMADNVLAVTDIQTQLVVEAT
jgi:hypothetical protein